MPKLLEKALSLVVAVTTPPHPTIDLLPSTPKHESPQNHFSLDLGREPAMYSKDPLLCIQNRGSGQAHLIVLSSSTISDRNAVW
jgi:hypothetical protein